MIFLVDSGSTHSFVDCALAGKLQGVIPTPVSMVKVANGTLVPCNQQLQKGQWFCAGHEFVNDFKVFPLGVL